MKQKLNTEKEQFDVEGGEAENNYDISQSAHPVAVLFTIIFKILAVISYYFLGLFLDDTFKFIIIVLLGCFDFWAVKNITGRLLIGMRWWQSFKENGEEIWNFESYDHEHKPNMVDKSFFWTSQIAITAFWLVLGVLNIMTFSLYSACLDTVGFVMGGVNLYGFYKCSKEHQQKMENMKKDLAAQGFKYMVKQKFKK